MVSLHKYDSQKSEFVHFRNILVPKDKVDKVANEFIAGRTPVVGFYKYSWAKAEGNMDLYCVSPAVFDDIEISQI